MSKYFLVVAVLCSCSSGEQLCGPDASCTEESKPYCAVEQEMPVCIAQPDTTTECVSSDSCGRNTPICGQFGFCTQCWNAASASDTCETIRLDTPFCAEDGQCRGCIDDAECESKICGPEDQCVLVDAVVYVEPGGIGTGCSKLMPCGSFEDAIDNLSVDRWWIHLAEGTYIESLSFSGHRFGLVGVEGATITNSLSVGSRVPEAMIRQVTFNGGGIVSRAQQLQIENVHLMFGFGLHLHGGSSVVANTRIETCSTGVTLFSDADITMTDSVIAGSAEEGISVDPANSILDSGVNLERVVIEDNGQAGISMYQGTILNIHSSVIRGNGNGGVQISSIPFLISNSMIVDNKDTLGTFSGVYVLSGSPFTPQDILFSTIANNEGDNLDCRGNSPIIVDSSIIALGTTPGRGCEVTNSLLPAEDPQFVDTINYELSAGSPAIDTGSAQTLIDNNIIVDVDGTTRPQGSAPDMGAQEFTP